MIKRLLRLTLLYLGLIAVLVMNMEPLNTAVSTVKVIFEYQKF
jgi:diacylglycerol kinase